MSSRTTVCNKLHTVFPNLTECIICPRTNRKEETVMARLHIGKSTKICLGYKRRSTCVNPLPLSVSLRSIIMTTSLDHSVSYLFFNPRPIRPFCCCCLCFLLFVCFLFSFCSFVCSVASDVLTTICHLTIVNVCMIIILYIGNTQICILLLCFLYLFVELMIMMNE